MISVVGSGYGPPYCLAFYLPVSIYCVSICDKWPRSGVRCRIEGFFTMLHGFWSESRSQSIVVKIIPVAFRKFFSGLTALDHCSKNELTHSRNREGPRAHDTNLFISKVEIVGLLDGCLLGCLFFDYAMHLPFRRCHVAL